MTYSTPPGVPPTPGTWPPAPGAGYPANVPPAQVLEHDQPCRKCGYNLRGLATNNRCPECGTPVGFSYHGDLLRFSDPGWVELLARGARSFIIGVAIIFFTILGGMILVATLRDPSVAVVIGLGAIVGWIFTLIGWWYMTQPDPSGLGEDQYGTVRKIIRITLILGIVKQVLDMGIRFAPPDAAFHIGLQLLDLLFGVAAVVGFWAQLNYLKKLALRIPDDRLSNRANFLMYALGISYGLLIVIGVVVNVMIRSTPGAQAAVTGAAAGAGCFAGILGIAVLVFLVMYLFLVQGMGRRFKEQAAAARSTWAAAAFTPPAR